MADAGTRETILRCAREIYLAHGVRGMSMRRVAACAGISATAIYRHFDSKEVLLGALCEAASKQFATYLWRGLEGRDPRERLALTGQGYLRFALEQPQYYRVLWLSASADFDFPTDTLSDENTERIGPTFLFLVDRVRECIDDGLFIDDDPFEIAGTIWAHTHGLVSLYISGHLTKMVEDEEAFVAFFGRSLNRLFDGLITRA